MGLTSAMTAFDWAAVGLVGVSALIGLARGATREITGLVALAAAAILALASGRLLGGVFTHVIHPAWLAAPAGMAGVFLIAFIALRLAAGVVARSVHAAGLGGMDRLLGLGVGVVRGVAALGVFALVVGAVFPTQSTPRWIGSARLYPLARGAGDVLRSAAPRVLDLEARPDAGADPGHAQPTRSDEAHSLTVVEDSR